MKAGAVLGTSLALDRTGDWAGLGAELCPGGAPDGAGGFPALTGHPGEAHGVPVTLWMDGASPQQQVGEGFWVGGGEQGYVSTPVYKLPPKKTPHGAVGIEEESKHCSAPGSQVQTDIFFFPWLPGRRREAFQCLPPCPLRQQGWHSCRLGSGPWAGLGCWGKALGTLQGMHGAQVNKNKLLEQPCATAGEPGAAAAGKELMVDPAQG